MTIPPLAAALERFAAAHAEDPRGLGAGYHARLRRWVDALAPAPGEALVLACACQHLRRWRSPRAGYPAGLAGYKRWRSDLARFHADEAEAVLRAVGYDDAVVTRVRALLLKQGLRADPEVQLFEDAICLTFIEGELEDFAKGHDEPKLARILSKTWHKMSPAGHAAALELAATLPEALRALLVASVAKNQLPSGP